jgi:hypothetical protein
MDISFAETWAKFAPQTDLSLDEVEQLLERWKLQGPGG